MENLYSMQSIAEDEIVKKIFQTQPLCFHFKALKHFAYGSIWSNENLESLWQAIRAAHHFFYQQKNKIIK